MVVSSWEELYEKFFRGYTRKQWGIDPSELDKSVPPAFPPAQTVTGDISQIHVSGNACTDIPGCSRRCCRTQTSKSCSTLIIGRLWGYTVPGDDLHGSGWWILRLPLRKATARWSSAWDAQHACASNSCSRELSEWASIHPRHRVQILDRTGACKNLASSTSTRASRRSILLYRVQRTELYKKYKALADAAPGVNFVGRLATYKYYNMDQVVAQALTMYSRLQALRQLGFARERRPKLVPVQSSVAKTFEDIKSW